MSATEQLAVEALNKAKLASKAQLKVQHLGELHELLIKNDPGMLDRFLPELVEFQVDKAVSVRRRLLDFLTAAVQVRGTPGVITQTAACLAALLADEQVAVAKQAAVATHCVLHAGLVLHVGCPQGDAGKDAAWAAVQQLQASVSSLATSSTADVGLRMAGIKLSEQAALLYTGGDAAALPDAAALATAADGLITALCGLLKEPGVEQQPGPVIICSLKALGTVVMQRGHTLPKVMPVLLALALKGIYKAPVASDGQSCIAASCGAVLKEVLARVLRSNSDATRPWQTRLDAALRAIGADAVADSALRHIDRQAARLRAAEREKRKATEQGGPDAKIPRSTTPAGAESSVGNTPTRTPTPTPMLAAQQGQQQGQGGDVLSMLLPGGVARSADPTTDVQRVLEVLVEHQQHQAVETIIAQVSPEVLAELVLRWMSNLPPKPASEAAAGPDAAAAAVEEAAAGAAAGPAAAEVAGPSKAGSATQQQQQQQRQQQQQGQPPAAVKQELEAAAQQQQAAATATLAAAAAQQQQQLIDPRRRVAAAPPAAAAAAAAPQLPSPLPTSLNAKQVQHMRKSAVQRILDATKNKPIRNFRELLLSRLVSQAPQTDGLSDLMLQHVLADYHGSRGHVLAVRWLYALAAMLAAEATGGATTGGAAAAAALGTEQQPGQAAAGNGMEGVEGAQQQQQQAGDVDMHDVGTAGGSSPRTRTQQLAGRSSSTGGNSSTSSSGPLQDLSGTQYDAILMALLQGLKQQLPSSDTAIPRLLQDVPVLPLNSIVNFLRQLLSESAEWAAAALSAAHTLIDGRPPMRQQLLQLVLDASVAADASTREQAVRLVVSKLMSWPAFTPSIVEYAQAQLLLLLEPGRLMARAQQQQQDSGQDTEQQQVKQEQQQQEAKPLDQAAAAAAGGETASENGIAVEQETEQQQQQPPDDQIQQQQGQPGGSSQAKAEQQQQQGAVKLEQQPGSNEPPEPELDVEVAAQHCMLFMSVCALKPELMTVLLETYGKAGAKARSGMDRYAASLARAIGPTSPQLLQLVKSPPEGSRDLLLQMLNALADQQLPPQPLVAACVANFTASKDVQLLAPVAVAMPKNDIIKLLPQLVAQLSRQQLRLLYRKLTGQVGGREAHFKPTELLVALHQIRSSQALRVTTKQQTAALDVALHAPEVFPVAVVVQAIRRLETSSPLPQLFMRTVISALQISPKLTDTIMELLKRLITKQVWTDVKQWQGFIICCEKAAPASYPVLLQLPPNILELALEKLNERHWRELLKYATGSECTVPVFQPVRDVLNIFLERLTNRQKAKLAAAAATAAGGAEVGGGAAGGAAAAGAAPAAAAGAAGQAGISSVKARRAGSGAAVSKPGAGGTAKAKHGAAAAAGPQQSSAAGAQAHKPAAAGQQGGEAPPAAAATQAEQQQQQQQQEGEGAEDEFMLDFEDD